jgi:hypothetical protein
MNYQKQHPKEYRSWASAVQRCSNPNNHAFHLYGGRGIRVCEQWSSFVNFFKDMGLRPENTSLDRIDNNKGYEPGNCRWATRQQQSDNRYNIRVLTYNGKTQTLREWSAETGISLNTMRQRVVAGWSAEKCITLPTKNRKIGPNHTDGFNKYWLGGRCYRDPSRIKN